MKKKFATLAFIAVLSLSMASLASAAGVAPQGCPIMAGGFCDMLQ